MILRSNLQLASRWLLIGFVTLLLAGRLTIFCDAVAAAVPAAHSQAMTAGCTDSKPIKKAPHVKGDCLGSCVVTPVDPVRDVARLRFDGPAAGDRSVVFHRPRVVPDDPPPRLSKRLLRSTMIT